MIIVTPGNFSPNPDDKKVLEKSFDDAKNNKKPLKAVHKEAVDLKNKEDGKEPICSIPKCKCCGNDGSMRYIILCSDCFVKLNDK